MVFNFSEMSFDKQIQLGLILPLIPFLFSYTLFFYLVIILEWEMLNALFLSSTSFFIGFITYFMMKDKIRTMGMALEGMDIRLRWSPTVVYWENLMVSGKIPLRDELLLEPVKVVDKIPQFKTALTEDAIERRGLRRVRTKQAIKIEKIDMGLYEAVLRESELRKNFFVGKFASELTFDVQSVAPNGIPFRKCQFLHLFPQEKDFLRCPDQLLFYKTQILNAPTSVIDATFLYWGERTEPIPVFLITSSPEMTRVIQESIGIKPSLKIKEGMVDEDDSSDYGGELRVDIEKAMKLGDTNEAMGYAMVLKTRSATIQTLTEQNREVGDIAGGVLGRFLQNEDEIFNERKPTQIFRNWKFWLGIIAFLLSITFLWWILS